MMWLFYSLIALVCWGFWGVFSKIALNHLKWQQLIMISISVNILVYLFFYLYYRPSISIGSPRFYPALLVGLSTSMGMLSTYLAVSTGKLSVVMPLTSLYPILTVAISFFVLGEEITLSQGLGIIFAAIAIVLFSI